MWKHFPSSHNQFDHIQTFFLRFLLHKGSAACWRPHDPWSPLLWSLPSHFEMIQPIPWRTEIYFIMKNFSYETAHPPFLLPSSGSILRPRTSFAIFSTIYWSHSALSQFPSIKVDSEIINLNNLNQTKTTLSQ